MNTASRLAIFAAAVAVAVGSGALAGAAIDPIHEAPSEDEHDETSTSDATMGGHEGDAAAAPAGLAIADGTLRLDVEQTTFKAGVPTEWRFRILDAGGHVVTDFEPEQGGVEAHLIVVSRDFAQFDHLHPTMAADGTWSIDLTLPAPGAFRAFVDVSVGGEPHTLGIDLDVPGSYAPVALPGPSLTASVDGYEVERHGDVIAGDESDLSFSVSKDGDAVELEPYLGAAGHLVVLRAGDLAYLHTHPSPTNEPGRIPMATTFPSPGSYRLFLQFQHEGLVRTAAFTVEVP